MKGGSKKTGKSPRKAPLGNALEVVEILLNWMQTPGNYARWQKGMKTKVLPEILDELKANGLSRRGSSIKNHMNKIEASYRAARKVLTTMKISENELASGDVKASIKAKVLKACPYFDRLLPVMRTEGEPGKIDSDDDESLGESSDDAAVTHRHKSGKRHQAHQDHLSAKRTCRSPFIVSTQIERTENTPPAPEYRPQHSQKCEVLVQRTHTHFTLEAHRHLERLTVKQLKQLHQVNVKSAEERHKAMLVCDVEMKQREIDIEVETKQREKDMEVKVYRLRSRNELKLLRGPDGRN